MKKKKFYGDRFIGGVYSFTSGAYAVQFQNAFEILLKEENGDNITLTTLPLFYLLRHYLELALKCNIKYFQKHSGLEEFKDLNKTHVLSKLCNELEKHIEASFSKINLDDAVKEQYSDLGIDLKRLISNISKLDDDGFAFRYSYDKNGNRNLDNNMIINLQDMILKYYEKASKFLNYSILVYEDYSNTNSVDI